jgi:hypothetical protein
MVLRIFLRVIAHSLQSHSPGAAKVDNAALHIGAVAFIHRFGSSLNEHVHFHVCVVDGVFEAVAGEEGVCDGVIFHPTTGIDPEAAAQAQARLRRRILRAFVGRGLLEAFEAKEMLGYKHSGFSVDTSVCIAAHDRAGLERLLRYCARAVCPGAAAQSGQRVSLPLRQAAQRARQQTRQQARRKDGRDPPHCTGAD